MMNSSITENIKQRVIVNTDALPWAQTSSQNISQKIMERNEHGDYEQITSLVRYGAGAIHPSHCHPNGEEIFVLEGIFSDEKGDFLTGSYIRNPPSSFHQPYSKYGCIIFTKTNQMLVSEQKSVYQDNQNKQWMPSVLKGIDTIHLHSDNSETVELVRYQAGLSMPYSHSQESEEILILEGQLRYEDNLYSKGTWISSPLNSKGSLLSPTGCIIYRKTNHLIIQKELNS